MSPQEALNVCRMAKALSPAQAVDEYQPEAWALVLKRWRLVDAMEALEQLGSEQEFIHVSHIVKRIKRIRQGRIDKYASKVQPPNGITGREYEAWLRRTTAAIADGDLEPEPEQLTPRKMPDLAGLMRRVPEDAA